MRKPTIWVQTRSDTNWPVQLQKMARSLKFLIYLDEELYYLCSENKGTDHLCSYCTADLCLCFLHRQKSGFLMTLRIHKYTSFEITIMPNSTHHIYDVWLCFKKGISEQWAITADLYYLAFFKFCTNCDCSNIS